MRSLTCPRICRQHHWRLPGTSLDHVTWTGPPNFRNLWPTQVIRNDLLQSAVLRNAATLKPQCNSKAYSQGLASHDEVHCMDLKVPNAQVDTAHLCNCEHINACAASSVLQTFAFLQNDEWGQNATERILQCSISVVHVFVNCWHEKSQGGLPVHGRFFLIFPPFEEELQRHLFPSIHATRFRKLNDCLASLTAVVRAQ